MAHSLFHPLDSGTRRPATTGDAWLFDLGMAEKVRPALVVSVGYGDVDRALITILPHTTSLRGSQYEITVNVPFLEGGRIPSPERGDISERKGDLKSWGRSNPISSIWSSPGFFAGSVAPAYKAQRPRDSRNAELLP